MHTRCKFVLLLSGLLSVVTASAGGAPNDSIKKADALFREGHFVDAEKAYRAILSTDDAYGQATLRIGEIALLSNRYDDAERHLRRAMKLRPDDERPKSLLAEVYTRQDKFAQAADLLRKLGRTEGADRLATFEGKTPYETVSDKDVTRVKFVQTDPLPIIKAKINGGEEIYLLIDTGAAELVLDPEFATSVGAVRFGSTTGVFAGGKEASVGRATIESIQLGDFLIRNLPVRLLPTRRLPFAVGGERINGILGTVLMYHFVSTLNYPAGDLVLRRKTDVGRKDLKTGISHLLDLKPLSYPSDLSDESENNRCPPTPPPSAALPIGNAPSVSIKAKEQEVVCSEFFPPLRRSKLYQREHNDDRPADHGSAYLSPTTTRVTPARSRRAVSASLGSGC